jgi:hypothetical protein
MPNHVKQRLTVTGTPEDVEAFMVTARGARPDTGDRPKSKHESPYRLRVEPLCFHLIAPIPDEFCEKPYGHSGSVGYELEVKFWGTKWGAYGAKEPVRSEDGTRVAYDFTCAWGPPVEGLRRASLRYPTLRFYLSWGGEGPCRGRHAFGRGLVTLELCDDYQRDIEPDMPTDEEDERDENAAELKYINSHDVWVTDQIMGATFGCADAKALQEATAD